MAAKTPHDLWEQSLKWIRETGWPSYAEDTAIADTVYRAWIDSTNQQFLTPHHRDRERLSDALEAAFRPVRDDSAADCLYALFMVLFEIRGRREGILQRDRNH